MTAGWNAGAIDDYGLNMVQDNFLHCVRTISDKVGLCDKQSMQKDGCVCISLWSSQNLFEKVIAICLFRYQITKYQIFFSFTNLWTTYRWGSVHTGLFSVSVNYSKSSIWNGFLKIQCAFHTDWRQTWKKSSAIPCAIDQCEQTLLCHKGYQLQNERSTCCNRFTSNSRLTYHTWLM